jgi:HEAT repeat protein
MKFQNQSTRTRFLSLSFAAVATVSLLLLALSLTSPVYSQGQSEKAWEILKTGAASKSVDSRVRTMSSMDLLSKNPTAEKLALAALGDEKPEVRAAAASCLGAVGSKETIPALKKAAQDTASEVVFAAANALYMLSDPAAYQVYYAALTGEKKSGESLLDSQLKMLKDPKALAKLGFEGGIGFIPFAGVGYSAFKTLSKDDETPVRAAAALKLARDPDPKSGEALAKAAGDPKWMVRAAAIDAIGRRGDAALLKAVVTRMTDENETVRFIAAACVIRLSK